MLLATYANPEEEVLFEDNDPLGLLSLWTTDKNNDIARHYFIPLKLGQGTNMLSCENYDDDFGNEN